MINDIEQGWAQVRPPQDAADAGEQRGAPGWVRPLVIVAALLLVVAATAAATLVIAGGGGRQGLSPAVAQRQCRTAVEQEAQRRAAVVGDDEVVVSIKRIDLQETYTTDAGVTVNATVAYTLTAGFLPQIEQSVSLTCEATGTDDRVATTVKNRGE